VRTARLGDVCTFKPSKRLARTGLSESDPVSFVPMNDLGIHQKFLTAGAERPLSEVAGSYTYFAEGDVLLAKITPCFENGKLGVARGLINGVGFGSSEFTVIRPGPDVLAEYVYYFLDRDEVRECGAKVMTGAVGHKRVPQEFIERLEIPLPPLEEQRRMVAVLDEAFAAIATATANAERNLVNAREILLGFLNAIVNDNEPVQWDRIPLGDLCEILDRLRKPITKSDRRPGEYPYYGATGIVDWVDNYIFDEPLVLLGEDGAKWGPGERSAFSASGKFWVNNHAHVMRPHRDILSDDWLIYCLNMADLMPYVTGVTVPKLNQERMRSILIPLPPLETQHELVARMDSLSDHVTELTVLNNDKIAALANLKQSLLHRAFSGELTVRELVAA
jgi:type I restriction enzyme, S subunit